MPAASTDRQRTESSNSANWIVLFVLACLTAIIYVLVGQASHDFHPDAARANRPIPFLLGLFGLAFAIHLVANLAICRIPDSRRLAVFIVATSALFRLVLIPSTPIQEIDIYRYMWDGAVSSRGVNPYRYSPHQVISAATQDIPSEQIPDDLSDLISVARSSAALSEIVQRVHYGYLPTVYPAVSQVVFAAAHWTTPANASTAMHLTVMKSWIVLFDLATLVLVIWLTRRLKIGQGLSILYGWCPLLMKEFANSGHLDAIAVFLTTLAIYLALVSSASRGRKRSWLPKIAALVLGLAVGAKLYPIVVAPLLLLYLARSCRDIWVPAIVFIATVTICCWPMLPRDEKTQIGAIEQSVNPGDGIVAFLRHWEINDLFFLTLIENVNPTASLSPSERPWFSVLPRRLERTRQAWCDFVSERFSTNLFPIRPQDVPFLTARAITLLVFAIVGLTLAVRCSGDEMSFVRGAFLTIAWFWLLCPTLNPWYWSWALPLLPVMRNRAWYAISGLVLIYYLRFFLEDNFATTAVAGTPYSGIFFFDFVIPWFEFGPWVGFLLLIWWRERRVEIRQSCVE